MFGLFKKKSEVEKLRDTYASLLKEAYDLSKVNRLQSDNKTAEAEQVLKRIEELEKNI